MDKWQFVQENQFGMGNVFKAKGIIGIDELKDTFPNGVADRLNFCLFSTSGVHGRYSTIEDVEKYINDVPIDNRESDDDRCDTVTFIMISPRVLLFKYGNVRVVSQDDVDYLKKLRETSTKAIAGIGY